MNSVRANRDSQNTAAGCCSSTASTLTNVQLVQNCIGQNVNKHPVIIDTDTDIDDMWAILYLINVTKFKHIILTSLLLPVIKGSNS